MNSTKSKGETKMFDERWNEADWQNECAAAEKDERAREARDMADWHAETPAHGDLPAMMQDDAGPIGMSCEPEPSSFGMELSTSSMLRARFGKRVA